MWDGLFEISFVIFERMIERNHPRDGGWGEVVYIKPLIWPVII